MIQSAFLDLAEQKEPKPGGQTELEERIVNVASVPQRSPFRYPGGKTWLVPYVRRWLASLQHTPAEFLEPFAGGGIVSLTVAAERLAEHVTMVELDPQVAAVWKTILCDEGGGEWLAEKIGTFTLTSGTVASELAQAAPTTRDQAFKTILRNRVSRGGILAPGAGIVKQGESGRGLLSRWYPDTLKRRILALSLIRERIAFVEADGLSVMEKHVSASDLACFIDPPYSAGGKRAGTRLYTHNEIDHERLFELTDTLAGPFLMTYDDAPEVWAMAQRHGFAVGSVPMKNTHHAKMRELLVSRDLSWLA